MCFSAEADFVSGAVVSVIGVAALVEARESHEPRALPLAALPLAFGLHQIAEGFVWLGLNGKVSRPGADIALHLYLAFAWVLLPVLVPLAVWLVEPERWRRRLQGSLVVLGAATGLSLMVAMLQEVPTAEIAGNTIRYHGAGGQAGILTVMYVVATCGAFLTSSRRLVAWFGIANLGAVGLLLWLQENALTSLWCVWAAIASVLLYVDLVNRRRHGAPAGTDAVGAHERSSHRASARGHRSAQP